MPGSRSIATRSPNCRAISRRRIAEIEQSIWRDVGQRIQHRLDQAIGRRAVREAAAARRQEGQDRRLRHRRLDPGDAGAAASGAGAGARMAAADQAQIDLCRRARRRISTARPAACTPPSRWPRPRPGGCRRPSPTSRTSRSAPRKGEKSAAPLSPSRAICCCRPITARSNCGSRRMSPTSPS